MYAAKAFETNSSNLNKSLLIATQGSDFKDALVKNVIDYYKEDSIYIKVIDVSSLTSIDPANYSALLVIHTWENWKPPVSVKLFIERTMSNKNKIVVFTTSGAGNYAIDEIDAITGESKIEDLMVFTDKIIERLTPLLNSIK